MKAWKGHCPALKCWKKALNCMQSINEKRSFSPTMFSRIIENIKTRSDLSLFESPAMQVSI